MRLPDGAGFSDAWQQVGRVGLDHQASRGNPGHQRQQVTTAPLVADPSRHADRQIQLQALAQFTGLSGEAMRHGVHQMRPELPHDAR